jgi:Uma2 family endonuclease
MQTDCPSIRAGGLAMTTTSQPKIFTLAEFLTLPETKPASEFIVGSIEQKPMPQGQHSRLQLKLCNLVNDVAETATIAMALPDSSDPAD